MGAPHISTTIRDALRLVRSRGQEQDLRERETEQVTLEVRTLRLDASAIELEVRDNSILRVRENNCIVLDATHVHPGESGYGEAMNIDGQRYRVDRYAPGDWSAAIDQAHDDAFMRQLYARASSAPPAGSCASRTARDS